MRIRRNNLAKKVIASLFIFIGALLSAGETVDANKTKMTLMQNMGTATITKTYQDANSSENNISKFGIKDWENEFNKNGLTSTSIIGNTMSLFGNTKEGKLAVSGDLEKMKTSELKNNSDFAGNKSIGAFDSLLQSAVMTDVVNNAFGKPSKKSKNIKCYITRDVGQTYMCTAPGNSLMMSSGMSGRDALSKLKSECEGQCFTQNSCINMQQDEQNITTSVPQKNFTLTKSNPSFVFYIPVDSNVTINTIEFKEVIKGASVKYTVSYKDQKGIENKLVEKLLSISGTLEEKMLYVGDISSQITIRVELSTPYADTISANMLIDGIKINYHSNAQYVCPSIQDISNHTPGDFANVCSNGKTTVLTKSSGTLSKTYKICASSIYPGQNLDGSFYQQHACESVCRRQYECKLLPGGSVNFEGLKGFREGCIENTSLSCNNFNNDCRQARLAPDAKVINELVFGGNLRPVSTIVNGATTGVERPRLSISSLSPDLGPNGGSYAPNDTEFETQRKEEWKDKAYSDMMANANWNVTRTSIGENTSANHAYGINLKSGSFYGYAGTSVRSLMWRLKPAAFDVDTGLNFKMYSIIRVIVQNYRYEQSGTGGIKPFYDEIWYMKTGAGDSFKPFYYNFDAYEIINTTDEYNLTTPSYRPKTTSNPQYMTFDGTSWGTISSLDTAESFKNEGFTAVNAFWEYEIMGNMEGKYDVLPGIVRRIEKNDQYNEVIHYTGTRDHATAGTIIKMLVSTGYSQSSLSYQSIKEMVDNGNITTIFETGNENSYPRYFRGDGEKENDVVVYIYGQQSNGSAYFNIRPRKDHIGKKGFIYVYGE